MTSAQTLGKVSAGSERVVLSDEALDRVVALILAAGDDELRAPPGGKQ